MDPAPKYEFEEPAAPVVQRQPVAAGLGHADPYHVGYDQPRGMGGASNTSVTLNMTMIQQQQRPQMRTWSTSLCGCFEDMGSCCLITWFAPCYLCCALSPRLGESCCAPLCLALGGHSVPMIYRTKVRAAQGIAGGAIDDCCLATNCALCVLCQIKRELDYVERSTGLPAF